MFNRQEREVMIIAAQDRIELLEQDLRKRASEETDESFQSDCELAFREIDILKAMIVRLQS